MYRAMTKRELITALERHPADDDTPVHIGYNYGDHAQTLVAPPLRAISEDRILDSEYHKVPKVVDPEHRRFEEGTDVLLVGDWS